MTSEARDKIRELRLVAAQCYKQAEAANAARDEAVRNLGKALLDVPAGDWPGAVVGPIDGDHVGCGPVTHNLARWPRVPAVEPPPVSTIELIQRACNPRIGDLYKKAGGRLVVTAIDDDLVCYVSGPNSKPGVIPTTEWGLLARNTINNGAQFVPAVEPPPGVDCAGCGAE